MLEVITTIIGSIVFFGPIFGIVWLMNRAEEKDEEAWRIKSWNESQKTIAFLAAHRAKNMAERAKIQARKQRILDSVRSKHWTEVRILCAAYTNCECECARKEDAAVSIYNAQMRLDKELGE